MSDYKSEVFAALRAKSATAAEVEFSGGNDEGGVDGITLFIKTADGPILEVELEPYWGGGSYVNGRYVQDKADGDARLAQLLSQPIDDQYGSFAGEFDVYGKLSFDVDAGTVTMDKNESVQSFDHYEYEL